MAATVTNWTEFDAALTAAERDIIVNGEIDFPTSTTRTVPVNTRLTFTPAGFFDFQDDASANLVIDGVIDAPSTWWIFRNVVVTPVDPGWGAGGSSKYSWSFVPNVHGDCPNERHTGWWGAYDSVDGKTTIQCALDSAPKKNGGQTGPVTVRLAAIGHGLPSPIQVTGRHYAKILGSLAGDSVVTASDASSFADDANGNMAMFYADYAPGASGGLWHFGFVLSGFNCYAQVFGLSCCSFVALAEGSEISNMGGSWSRYFLFNEQNAIGPVIRSCHFTGGDDMTDDAAFLVLGGSSNPRFHISDITYNHAGGAGSLRAFCEIRAGQLVATRCHVEDTRNLFLIGNPSGAQSMFSATVIANGIDWGRLPAPISGDTIRGQNSAFAVRDWKYSQVVASGIQISGGAPDSTIPWGKAGRDTWWLKCVSDTNGRSGEIPVNTASGNHPSNGAWFGSGQASFGQIVHNGRPFNTPSQRLPGIYHKEEGSLSHGHESAGTGPDWLQYQLTADEYIDAVIAAGATVSSAQRAAIEAFYAKDWFSRIPNLWLWFTSWGVEDANKVSMRAITQEYLSLTYATQDDEGLQGVGSSSGYGIINGALSLPAVGASASEFSMIAIVPEVPSGSSNIMGANEGGNPRVDLRAIPSMPAWAFTGGHGISDGYNAVVSTMDPAVLIGSRANGKTCLYVRDGVTGFQETLVTSPNPTRAPQLPIGISCINQTASTSQYTDASIGLFGISGEGIDTLTAQELTQDLKGLWEGVTGNTL